MKRALFLFVLAAVLLFASSSFAQGSAQLAPVTPGIGVALALSLIIGALQSMIQSGSIFGIATTPKAWLPRLTVAITFLTGVTGFVTNAPGGFVFSLTDIVYALAAGISSIVAGSAGALVPALAQHAHTTLPAMRFAARK